MLSDAARAVKGLKDALIWFPSEKEKDNGPDEMQAFLDTIVVTAVARAKKVPLEKLGVSEKDTSAASEWFVMMMMLFQYIDGILIGSRGRKRAGKVKKVSLAAAGDIEEIWALYVQLFEISDSQVEGLLLDLEEESGRREWDGCEDLGVGSFAMMGDDKLNGLLNFASGRPTLFARFRSRSGKCAWDDSLAAEFREDDDDMQELALLWHQRVGVAALVETIWLEVEGSEGVPGVLIADEVGVGKTALTMGAIAFMIDAFWQQEMAGGKGRPDGVEVDLSKIEVKKAPILGECLTNV